MAQFFCQSTKYVVFLVESLTQVGTHYFIEYRDSVGWKCSCPAFQYREGPCKHIQLVKPRVCGWKGDNTVKAPDGRLRCPVCMGDLYLREDTSDIDENIGF